MDDELKVLEVINKYTNITQREIGEKCDFSTGKVNYIINELLDKGLILTQKIGRSHQYLLTEAGIEYLKNKLSSYQEKKINIHNVNRKPIHQAVILAAGETNAFDTPVSLLPLGEENENLIKRNLQILKKHGIQKIVMVVGYRKEAFHFLQDEDVILVENPKYKWTGSMASLACIEKYIDDDFLLLEHDILMEESAFEELINNNQRDCILITNESGSGDEAFVEIRNNYLYKISKDIHQFNRVDGEMVGISKLSYELFTRMLDKFADNRNPLINYEYLLLDVSRHYNIGYLKINDLVWGEIDTVEHYRNIINVIYPRLQRKEEEYHLNLLKEIISDALNISKQSIHSVEPFGGMTNRNFKVTLENNEHYVLRLPGSGTDKLINRINEKNNSSLASELGIDSELKYFNENTGVKISKLIPNAQTLNPQTAKWEVNMRLTTGILKKLHTSNIQMENVFDIGGMMEEYERLIEEENGKMYPDFPLLKERVMKIKAMYDAMGVPLKPCHNDTVPENFVKSGDDKIYLIDWEYSGMNDPVWDLAAHSLENSFSEKEEELFLSLYYPDGISDEIKLRMLMHKIFQDYIWSLWTVYKEAKGDDFADYGINRHYRALELTNQLISRGVHV